MPTTTTMQVTSHTAPASKWWVGSMTVWGAVLTAATTVAPAVAPLIGLKLTPDQIQTVGDAIIVLTQALGGLGGTAMTLVGRARASAPLMRRQVTLQL